MNLECLKCIINQIIKINDLIGTNDETKIKTVLSYLSKEDFNLPNPLIVARAYHIMDSNNQVYAKIKHQSNTVMSSFVEENYASLDDFFLGIKLSIIGNIIDFTHNYNLNINTLDFDTMLEKSLSIDDSQMLLEDLSKAKSLLYIGDNAGEIVFDKLLIKLIKRKFNVKIYFATRGRNVINDVTLEDALEVGMNQEAELISNGDDSLGTILSRASESFLNIYHSADIIIAKGQGNYETLMHEKENIYFLLMAKCDYIASILQTKKGSLICKKGGI